MSIPNESIDLLKEGEDGWHRIEVVQPTRDRCGNALAKHDD